ncbi:MAG TPA: preprotein translocase subunit SecE [Deltaproteobacteria bacterium]|nr:preprotein translocase subunit SecE [Deltaproteobacteria bacterium]
MDREKLAVIFKIQQFFQDVKAEWNKITWTGRKEIVSGTIAVVILSVAIAVFLAAIDSGLSWVVRIVLGVG